jgi:serralysin
LTSFESSFHQDLNGDSVISASPLSPSSIDSTSPTSLALMRDNFHFREVSDGSGFQFPSDGAIEGSDQYTVWNTSSNGDPTSSGVLSGATTPLFSVEQSFHQFLDGDDVNVGHSTNRPLLETFLFAENQAASALENRSLAEIVHLGTGFFFNH